MRLEFIVCPECTRHWAASDPRESLEEHLRNTNYTHKPILVAKAYLDIVLSQLDLPVELPIKLSANVSSIS